MYRFTDLLELKKDKSAVRDLKKFINGKDFSEVVLAKIMSSTLVHIMIEAEHAETEDEAIEMLLGYKADLMGKMVSNLIQGMTIPEICRKVLCKIIEDEANEEL